MKLDITPYKPPRWDEYWHNEPFPSIHRYFEKVKRGKPIISKLCMAAFSECMGDRFREGMAVLDYGCGSGRYANFMARRLENFRYWGVEPPKMVGHFRRFWKIYRPHQHIRMGAIGSEVEADAIDQANVALLISVMTHLPHEALLPLLQKFSPIFDRGGCMVFSCYLAEKSELGREKLLHLTELEEPEPDTSGYYREVYWDREHLESTVAEIPGLKLERRGEWLLARLPHQIFRIEKA